MIGTGGVAVSVFGVRREKEKMDRNMRSVSNNVYDSRWMLEGVYVSGNDLHHYAWIMLSQGGSPVMLRIQEVRKMAEYVPRNVWGMIGDIVRTDRDEYDILERKIDVLAKSIGYTGGWANGYVYSIYLKNLEFNVLDQTDRMIFDLYPYSFHIDGIDLETGLSIMVGYLVVNRQNYIRLLMDRGIDVSDLIYDKDVVFWYVG